MSTPVAASPPKPKRRWLTFSLRTFLLVVLLLAVGIGHVTNVWRRAEKQRAIVSQLRAKKWGIVLSSDPQVLAGSQPPGLWIVRRMIGDDAYACVDRVKRHGSPLSSDERLSQLVGLPKVKAVDFANWVDDDAIEELLKIRGLEHATLSDHEITAASFGRLAQSSSLKSLRLTGTGTTDESFRELAASSSLLYVEAGPPVSPEAGQALARARPECTVIVYDESDKPIFVHRPSASAYQPPDRW